jgi:hypothetical protein
MKLNQSAETYGVCPVIDNLRKDGNIMGFERWRKIGQIVIADLKQNGRFFNTTLGLFFFDNDHRRAFPLDGNVELAALINRRYGINPKEHGFKRVLADLQSEAVLNGQKAEIRRLAHYDSQKKVLYLSRFDGYVYRLDGNSVVPVPNGTDDVFFFDHRLIWEPYSYLADAPKGELDRQLIEGINFAGFILSVEEQRRLVKLWLLAVFFGSIQPTKIILLLLGEQGSGKTSALRRIQKCIFGARADLLSIEKDKQDGFVATVTTDPLALFDNIDERVSWLPYALSRLATGVTFSRRQLYTTNFKVEFPGVSWLGITSRTVRFMENQPDLPERTLILRLDRLRERQAEEELLTAIAEHRNEIWSELLEDLNRVVRHFRQTTEHPRVHFRMADFASFALQVAALWGCRPEVEQSLAKLEASQAEFVFEEEPIHQVLEPWLMIEANQGRNVEAGMLQQEWSRLATRNAIIWPFANGKSLGQRLVQLEDALNQKVRFEVTPDPHTKQNRYRFWPKQVALDPEVPVTVANDSADAEVAGTVLALRD